MMPSECAPLADELARLSSAEMVDAMGARSVPSALRRIIGLPLLFASRPLGRTLAEFDFEAERLGLSRAAALALERFGVRLTVSGACPKTGAALVLANHPGAYDALALMTAIDRPDLLILAAERTFLKALPRVSRHLVFVSDRTERRAGALRRAVAHLGRGGALLHFPAGVIEQDPAFPGPGSLLGGWEAGARTLVRATERAAGHVLVAGVRGVHSPRIKRLFVTRFAERRGVTTLAPLLQILARYRDVTAHVALGTPRAAADITGLGSEVDIQRELRGALLAALAAPAGYVTPESVAR